MTNIKNKILGKAELAYTDNSNIIIIAFSFVWATIICISLKFQDFVWFRKYLLFSLYYFFSRK